MQVDHKLLPIFSFNLESPDGMLVANVNKCLPKGNTQGVDLNAIEKLLNIKSLVGSDQEDKLITTEEETFVETYNTEILGKRQEQEEQNKLIVERNLQANEKIKEQVDQLKKKEDDDMETEFSSMIQEEEQAKIAKELAQQREAQERDDMCFKLAAEYLNNDYDQAKVKLNQANWDYEVVAQQFKQQAEQQAKDEEERERKVLEVIQACPNISDFNDVKRRLIQTNWNKDLCIQQIRQEESNKAQRESEQNMKIYKIMQECEDLCDHDEIRSMLIAVNWDEQRIINERKSMNVIELLLINCSNPNEKLPLSFDKDKGFGTSIIEQLIQLKPLVGAGQNAAYNIYRDLQKQQCINYIELSNTLESIGLQNQPNGPKQPGNVGMPKILYFNCDAFGMKFD